jgi:glycerol kinase
MPYIIGIDQSTQGTKAMLFDGQGKIVLRLDRPHRQIIDENGWVEHDPEEIYQNLIRLVRDLMAKSGVSDNEIAAVGISNQRETAMAWDRQTLAPVYNAIVWQCARGAAICERIEKRGMSKSIRQKTGLRLSPYFSAAKLSWIMENVPQVHDRALKGEICVGTMDSYLVHRLTGGKEFRTDYSNASRTQLFNIRTLQWDKELCEIFGIPMACMAEMTDSDGAFGETDFEGVLPCKVPIHGVMGDSHGALFGQGCLKPGMMKATYGTGSSIMMNIGETPIFSDQGVVTSLAWKTNGKVQYVLEGNINYTGAVITWLKDDMHLLENAGESERLAREADPADHAYVVPAFSGLGAPYWRSDAEAAIIGMRRTTGRKEIVKAGLSCIAYQIADVVKLMQKETAIDKVELRVDGGPTRNSWLMQFQSDILNAELRVPEAEELSAIGAAYAAGLSTGVYPEDIFTKTAYKAFHPSMTEERRTRLYQGWQDAVKRVL